MTNEPVIWHAWYSRTQKSVSEMNLPKKPGSFVYRRADASEVEVTMVTNNIDYPQFERFPDSVYIGEVLTFVRTGEMGDDV